jgi:hypothetical protein
LLFSCIAVRFPIITQDNQNQSVDLRQDCVDFMDQQSWVKSRDSVFRVNTFEDYKALNLKSNGKNKYNIILSISEDKVAKDAAEALFKKHNPPGQHDSNRHECRVNLSCSVALIDRCNLLTLLPPLFPIFLKLLQHLMSKENWFFQRAKHLRLIPVCGSILLDIQKNWKKWGQQS